MSNVKEALSDAKRPNLKIVNVKYWDEQVAFHEKDKDIIDTFGFIEKWAAAMEKEIAKKQKTASTLQTTGTEVQLTKELAEQTKPKIPTRMTYQLMEKVAREILYASWAYGEELATAYGERKDAIHKLRAYADDKNAPNRAIQPSWKKVEEDEKRRYLERKKELEQKYMQMDEATLVSLGAEQIEFKDERRLMAFFKDNPSQQRVVLLFLKLCQTTMREEGYDTLSRSIISLAKNKIHSRFPEDNKDTDHAIIQSWKYGEKYAECLGYSDGQIRKILPRASRVMITYDEKGR